MSQDEAVTVGTVGRVEKAADGRFNPSFQKLSNSWHQHILTVGNCHAYTTVTVDPVQDK